MAINFPNDPATNPGNGGQWTDPGGSGTWEVELINGEAIWTLVSTDGGGGGGGGAVSLNELNDVTLSNPQDTNVLQYNSATGQWINAPAPAAANVNLNDLGDVDTTAGTTGDILVKQSNGNWEAKTPANNGGIGEAPEDGTPYVRQDANWISMPDNGGGATLNIDEAPADGVAYTRKDNSWVPGVEAVSGSTAQIEGDNNIDTGTNLRAVTTGHVLTYDGSKFAPAAPTGGGGGGSSTPSITWNIGATGTASYDFNGPGFSSATPNPALTVVPGQTYVFNNTTGSHPFRIQSTSGTSGTPYNTGVTGNGTVGEVTFVVPMDAPAELFYQCTAHAGMSGTIAVLENSAGGGSGGTVVTGLWDDYVDNAFPADGGFRSWSMDGGVARLSAISSDGTDLTDTFSNLKAGDTVYVRQSYDPDTDTEAITNNWKPFEMEKDAVFCTDPSIGKAANENFWEVDFAPNSPWSNSSPDEVVKLSPNTGLGYYWEFAFGGIPEGGTLLPHSSYNPPTDGGGGGIEEAPNDGKQYARQNEGWAEVLTPADTDSLSEGSTNKYFPEAPNDGKQYARRSEGWAEVVAGGGGGGDGIEEAPVDNTLYARKDGEWASLEDTGSLAYGKLSTSGLPGVTSYETESAATSDGFTVLDTSSLADNDDGNFGVQLPAAFTNLTWLGEKDPDTATNGYQTIWVNGNGYASFMPTANAGSGPDSGDYPGFFGYDPVFSFMDAQALLFAFHNIDTILDMVCTKEVGDFFVIHMQWKDEYSYFYNSVGAAGNNGYLLPFNEYDPTFDPDAGPAREKKTSKKAPRASAAELFTGELWLGKDGSVRMAYGLNVAALSIVEESTIAGFSQQTSGIYKKGVPVGDVMGTAVDFKAFVGDNLVYGLDQTNDGNDVSGPAELLDWYIDFTPASTPFLLDAPKDGTVYGRQDGQWVEAASAGDGGGGSGGGSGSGTPDYYAPQSRRMAQGLISGFNDRENINSAMPIVRPNEQLSTLFTYAQPGESDLGDEGTFSVQPNNELFIFKEDRNGVQPFGFVFSANDLLPLTEQYNASDDLRDSSGSLTNILFIFATARFWRQFPGEAEEWKYVSVDFHIPVNYEENVTAASGYLGLKLGTALFGTEADEVKNFYDLIGCTQAELEGTHLLGSGGGLRAVLPDVVENSDAPPYMQLELYTRAFNPNYQEGGDGGSGPPALLAAGQDNGVGGAWEEGSPGGLRTDDGMVAVWRIDPEYTQNAGSGGDSGPPAKSLKDKPSREEAWAALQAKAQKYITENKISPKLSDGQPKAKKNPGGLGYQIPGYSETTSDPRKLYSRTVNCNAPRLEGSLQFDKLGFWDLYDVNPFIKGNTPAPNDTLVWDDFNGWWDLASFSELRVQKSQVEKIIEALNNDPELKAALKAALAD